MCIRDSLASVACQSSGINCDYGRFTNKPLVKKIAVVLAPGLEHKMYVDTFGALHCKNMKRIFRNRIKGGKGGSQCVATKSMNPTAKGATHARSILYNGGWASGAETKKKREKANEVKRLNGEIATARLDLGRREDKLEECEEYLRFLDGLTPKEWLAEFREVADDGEIGLESEDGAAEEKNEGGGDEDELEKNKPVPMYFTHPKQLLDVFAKLEEENLTLISEAQDIEDQLERDTEKRTKELYQLEMESQQNQKEITRLREAIVEEMQKKKAYGLESSSASSASASTSLSSPSPEQELAKLTEKVREVYESVVTTETKASSIEAVDMLREIEETLERYFVEIEKMPKDVVAEREHPEREHQHGLQVAEHLVRHRVALADDQERREVHRDGDGARRRGDGGDEERGGVGRARRIAAARRRGAVAVQADVQRQRDHG